MQGLEALGSEILTGLASVEARLLELRRDLMQFLPASMSSEEERLGQAEDLSEFQAWQKTCEAAVSTGASTPAVSTGPSTPSASLLGRPWEEKDVERIKSAISQRSRYAEITMDDLPMAFETSEHSIPCSVHSRVLAVVPSSPGRSKTSPAKVLPTLQHVPQGSRSEPPVAMNREGPAPWQWEQGQNAEGSAPDDGPSRVATPRSTMTPTHRAWASAATCESLRIAGSKDILRMAEELHIAGETRAEPFFALTELLPRLCGVLPWRRNCWLYQMAIWLLALACTLHLVLNTGEHMGDVALGLGALMGLPCLHCRRKPLLEAVWHLRIRRGAKEHCSALPLLVWVSAVVMRIWVADGPLLSSLLFAILTLINSAIILVMHRCCADLLALVDRFCSSVTAWMEFEKAVCEWNEIQASCYNVSAALQGCIAVQLTVAAFIVWEAMLDFTTKQSFTKGLLPPLIAVLPFFAAILRAATVTDKCSRVPPLLNSLITGEPLDAQRMYVVQYIKNSEAGFTVFNMRVTSTSALKAVYVTCAVAVGMMTQLHAILAL